MTSETTEYKERLEKNAPLRCEMCDQLLPRFEDRRKHMAETQHCACHECGGYMPPGQVYVHWDILHGDLHWNDHAAAMEDRRLLGEAMPWVREAHEKQLRAAFGETSEDDKRTKEEGQNAVNEDTTTKHKV